ncbi:ribose-phosphate pyrophosphokinase [Candidatus Methanoperedens nitroreducens]|uniref:Ribose-phosphate pyrophosphokinase n=1 Tax=Candidatus Methanoperedens nitratireducens TaxID=1392998 RepID=A0A062V4F4_9EURY|nr:ribose-phosphate diphosphokinase [Candidatus Methanoperedens nitroreducens]KCZ71463.1 ribose-phosphate pyrophosphokinase [Candidatus Methanoperedens nitroreducens]MDJ1421091.1 ribose-phosphate diphosphokinase [Candidatus Methanoperedens sp.]
MNIIGGPASQLLAGRVSEILEYNLPISEYRRFPDGELYTRVLDDFDVTHDITIIQSTVSDSDFISLLQLIDACSEAARINVVIPYMGYARQDKRFKRGEPISARAMARAIKADRVFTINIHSQSILDYFDAEAVNLDATPMIGEYIKNLKFKNPLIIAPDDGAIPLARSAASNLGIDYDFLEKTRISGEAVSIKPKSIEVRGRDVIIIDDIISTGGTMAETISLLRSQGAREVFAACVHPVLSNSAILKLFKAGVRGIIATDTLDKGVSVVSVAPVIASVIKNI